MSDEPDDAGVEPQPAGVSRRSWIAPILIGLFVGTTCAAGWFAVRAHGREKLALSARQQLTADLGRERARAAELDNELGACARDRTARATGEAEVRAELDSIRVDLEQLRKQRAESDARLKAFQALTARLQKLIDAGKLNVMVRDGRMIVKLPERILFASGSADLRKDGKAAIREVAGILVQFPDRRFMVAGHTDNVPSGGKYKTNWDLSTARAVTVTAHLVSSGMNPAKLVVAGYGPYEPAAPNTTQTGRAENRRIEIVLLPNLAELPPILDAVGAPPSPQASAAASAPKKPKQAR